MNKDPSTDEGNLNRFPDYRNTWCTRSQQKAFLTLLVCLAAIKDSSVFLKQPFSFALVF